MTGWLAEHVLAHGAFGILGAVLLLPALEAAVPVFGALMPGQTAVVAGGMLAWQGHVTVEATLLTAVAGVVLGNLAGYFLGRRWQARLLSPAGGARRRRLTERALGLIARRGAHAVLIGRFIAVLRTVVPTLCGATRMPLRRYLLWSAVSGALWAPTFVLIGYVMGPVGPG
ncbi:DedA family protein [Streptomyces sp. NPDC052052]|uniref:DedA family protein n=1 Tax=Streptomyces sp. NPDC052052 TaxID=3154756 RepID=UPI003443503B